MANLQQLTEEWRPVPDYEGLYEVSNLGNVRSMSRLITNKSGVKRQLKGRTMKLWLAAGEYPRVTLSGKEIERSYMVHILVAKAFIPNPFNKRTVNHIDGNKANNCISNLEWATFSENMEHAFVTGLLENCKVLKGLKGENHGYAKLNNVDVFMMKALSEHGFTFDQISKRFNVTAAHVGAIVNDKTWKHLTASELPLTPQLKKA